MDNLKQVIAKNLIKYRKQAKLTQLELAEKLMYSDKNISKWERAEAVPDVVVLKTLADMYGISVNDFLVESDEVVSVGPDKKTNNKRKVLDRKQILIVLLSISLVWLVSTVSFGVMANIPELQNYAWWCFILAIPITMIVTLVFTSSWCTNLANCLVVSGLIWSVALSIYICVDFQNIWLIFIVAIPLQILDILWFVFRKVNFNLMKQNIKQEKKHSVEEK